MDANRKLPEAAAVSSPLRSLRGSLLLLIAAVFAFHLACAELGLNDYRGQHLGTALEYTKRGIDLLDPIIVGFNANDTPTPLELPVWQALAAALLKAFRGWFGGANLASLFSWLTSLWPVFQLARSHMGERRAWWTLVFYTTQPLVFLYAGWASADGTCLVFAVWFLYCADQMLKTGGVGWFLLSTAFGVLSALSKAPFFFCAGLTSLFLLLAHDWRSLRGWVMLGTAGAVAVAVFAWWMHRNQAVWARAEFPLSNLLLGESSGMESWYFGSLRSRYDPALWLRGGWIFLNYELGGFSMLAFLSAGALCPGTRLAKLWYLAGLLAVLAFPNLFLAHRYYYLIVSPATAMLCAAAASALENRLATGRSRAARLFVPATAAVLLLSLVQWLVLYEIDALRDTFPRRMAALIRKHTDPEDKLVIFQSHGYWETANALFLSDRRGLAIWDSQILSHPEQVARLRELGFGKLVMLSFSPINTPRTLRAQGQRWTYQSELPALVQHWPTTLATEDIFISTIPRLSAQ